MFENVQRSFNLYFWAYAISVVYLMLCSMHIHFSWEYDWKMMYGLNWIVGILGFQYLRNSGIRIRFDSYFLKIVVFFHLTFIWNAAGISQMLNIPVALLSLLLLTNTDKVKLLNIWTNTFCFILVVSLFAWFLSWMGGLDATGTLSFGNGTFYIYKNYSWLCVRGPYVLRFNSVFLEPGHTSMIAAFTIYANKFNFRKIQVLLILLCSLFTLSLAGYVLIFFGYVLYLFMTESVKKILIRLIPYVFIVGAVYYISINYNRGNNYINTFIIERLQYDDEKVIIGNNRYLGDTDETFDKFVSSGEFIVGYDFSKYAKSLYEEKISGSGVKMFLFEKGLIGVVFIFLAYFFMCKSSINKRFMYSMFAVYILAFLQRAYPLWESWSFLFVLSTMTFPNRYSVVHK